MATRKFHKRHIRKIQCSKGSYYVTLPIELMRKMGWKERQRVEVRGLGKRRIAISDWSR